MTEINLRFQRSEPVNWPTLLCVLPSSGESGLVAGVRVRHLRRKALAASPATRG